MLGKKKFDISVVIPIYNIGEDYFCACMDSVASQTKGAIEVILVDDGSTDNTGALADEYAKKYEHFRCYHIKNRGVGHARNFGVKKARGTYIGFVDPDDVIAPDMYEKLYNAAERNGSDMAICNVVRFNSEKNMASNLHLFTFKDINTVSHITKKPGLLYDTCVWNKLFKRSLWKKHRIKFNEELLYEDIPVAIALNYFANKVSAVRGVEYMWRVRETGERSITQGVKTLRNLNDRISILKILDKFFERNVAEESLHYEKDVRILTFDMMIFINACLELDRESAVEAMRIMREYVSLLVTRKAYETLNELEKAIYQSILDIDYERFIKLADFRKNILPKLPYFEDNGRVYAKLPSGLIDGDRVDLTNKVKRSVPKFYINSIKTEEGEHNVRATLYLPKISIADRTEQKVKMQLVNEITGESTPLRVRAANNSRLTASKGGWVCEETGEEGSYNYDGTGYRFTIPSDVLTAENVDEFVILARYENRFIKGTATITNLSKKLKGASVINNVSPQTASFSQ